jgi:ribosomal protein S18 acetylase RimI-like enzyme
VLRRPSLEVVYMGVSAHARGRSIGNALLARAVDACERRQCERIVLAVDRENEPAVRLYARWGFAEITRRRAWIASAP